MSGQDWQPGEQHSSVKISQTAKGDPVVEVKAYSHDLERLDACREAAVKQFQQCLSDIGFRRAAVAS